MAKFLRKRRYWATFVETPQRETLFTGIYELTSFNGPTTQPTTNVRTNFVHPAGSRHSYALNLETRLFEYDGRLTIDWGPAVRAFKQYADKHDKEILEIRAQFQEESFPGYLRFIRPLSEINALPNSWLDRLKESKGVYLLVCPRTREQYIGSATGNDASVAIAQVPVLQGPCLPRPEVPPI